MSLLCGIMLMQLDKSGTFEIRSLFFIQDEEYLLSTNGVDLKI